MKNYKLIAIDIDGTLVNDKKEILEETKNDINKAYSKGVAVVIATGRSFPAAKQYLNQFEFNIPAILYNGAMIRNSKDGSVIYNQTFNIDKALEIFNVITEHDATCCFWSEDTLYFNRENKYSIYYEKITTIKPNFLNQFDESIFRHINKFIWFNKPEVLEDVKRDVLSSISGINYFKSQTEMLEVVPLGISKGETLAFLANHFNIDKDEVIAIGDDENDISMIEYAGLGVAMENAKEVVLECADYITCSNQNNGVGKVINKYII